MSESRSIRFLTFLMVHTLRTAAPAKGPLVLDMYYSTTGPTFGTLSSSREMKGFMKNQTHTIGGNYFRRSIFVCYPLTLRAERLNFVADLLIKYQ